MGVKNNEEKAPVKRILPDTLNEFLDDCIESEGKNDIIFPRAQQQYSFKAFL